MSDFPPSVFPPPSPVVGPTAGAPAPASATKPEGPGKAGYLLGVAIILIGGIIGIVLLVVGFTSVVKAFDFPRVVGSDGSISINRTGDYIVYEIGNDFEGTTSVIHPTVSVVAPDGTSVFAGTTRRVGTRRTMGAGRPPSPPSTPTRPGGTR